MIGSKVDVITYDAISRPLIQEDFKYVELWRLVWIYFSNRVMVYSLSRMWNEDEFGWEELNALAKLFNKGEKNG